jgi:alkaline phosphatase D
MKKNSLILIFLLNSTLSLAQQLISGPMLGYVEHQSALIWLETDTTVHEVSIIWHLKTKPETKNKTTQKRGKFQPFQPWKIELNGLMWNRSEYVYRIILNGKIQNGEYRFVTRPAWARWSKDPAPDFSFMLGSCTYLNDSLYDRPGKPYGQDPSILKSMSLTTADFMIWTGDNLYLREADWSSAWGIGRRNSVNRARPELADVLAVRPNYAIWDDHDFGPNDSNKSYELSDVSTAFFRDYWGNKTYGEDNKGIYSKFSYSDADFFLLDDRSFRDANQLPDTIDGKINPNKRFLGDMQLNWLKNALISSEARFKFIVCGSQVLNAYADKECMRKYPADFSELTRFIREQKIGGIMVLSGDRHFTELLKVDGIAGYPLYEYTCSPLTSGPYVKIAETAEGKNPLRVEGSLYADNNYGRVSVRGTGKERRIYIETFNRKGELVWSKDLPEPGNQ